MEGDAAVRTADPDAVTERETAAESITTSAEFAELDAKEPAVGPANKLTVDDTAPAEAGTTTPAVLVDPAASLESSKVAECGGGQPPAGKAVVDAGQEAEAEQSASAALVEGEAAGPAVEKKAAEQRTNDRQCTPTPAESAGTVAEPPAVEAANEPGGSQTPPAEKITSTPAVSIDTPESLESSSRVADLGDVQADSGGAPIDAGPETEAEQPAPAAEHLLKDSEVQPDSGNAPVDTGLETAAEQTAPAAECDGMVPIADPGAVEDANEIGSGDTTSAVADTATSNVSSDAAASLNTNVADLDGVQPDADDAPIDAGPETATEQPAPAAEALAGDGVAVPAVAPDAVGEADAGKASPTSAEPAGADIGRPAFDAANEPGGDIPPAEADTRTPAGSIDMPESLESSSGVADVGDAQPDSGDAPIDASPETKAEHPAPATEGHEALTAVDLGASKKSIAGEAMPTSAESVEAAAEHPAVEAANEPGMGDMAPSEADTTTPAVSIDLAASLASLRVVDLGDVQPATGDAPIDAVLEARAEGQPVKAAEGEDVVLAADPGVVREANAGESIPVVGVDTEQGVFEAASEPDGGQTTPVEPDITTPDVSIDPAASVESSKVADLVDVQPTTLDAVVDAGPGTEAEQPVSAGRALPEDSAVVTAADPDAVHEGVTAGEAIPTPAETAGLDAEQAVVISDSDKGSAEANSVIAADTDNIDPDGSLENAQVAEPGGIQPRASDAIDSGPETEPEHPAPAAEVSVKGDVLASMVEPGAASEEVTADGGAPTSAESAPTSAEQAASEAANEIGSGDMASAEVDIMTAVLTADMAGSLESANHADFADVQCVTSDAVADGPETDAEQSVLAVEVLTVDSTAMPPAADPDFANEANAGDVVATSAESATISADQPAVEPAIEPGSGETTPAEAITQSVVATAGSIEIPQVVQPSDVQSPADDALVDAGPETEAEQPALAAKALGESGELMTATDAGAAEGVTAGDAVPMAIVSAGVESAVEAANEPTGDQTAPEEAGTTTPAVSIDPAESNKVADLGDVQPAVGETLIDADPETGAEQPVPATEALAGDDTAAPVPDVDNADKEANAGDAVPTCAESAGADTEQAAVETAIDPGSDDSSPVKADTSIPVVGIDPAGSNKVEDLGHVQPAPGDTLVDAGSETEAEQSVPTTEALASEDAAVLAAGSDAVGEASASDMGPTSAESAGENTEQAAVETANDLDSGDTPPAEADTTPPTVSVDTPESLECSSGIADVGDVQPTAGDAPVSGASHKTEVEQPVPAAGALAESEEVVPAVDPGAVEKASIDDVMQPPAESAGEGAKHPAVEATDEPGGDGTAPPETDTETADVGIDPAASLDSSRVAGLGDVQPTAGDALVDTGPETAAEQPGPAAGALAEGEEVVLIADPYVAGEASAGDAVPPPAESVGGSGEQRAVEAANELSVDDTAPAEAETTASASNVDLTTALENGDVVESEDTQPASAGVDELIEVEAAAAIAEDSSVNVVITVSIHVAVQFCRTGLIGCVRVIQCRLKVVPSRTVSAVERLYSQ